MESELELELARVKRDLEDYKRNASQLNAKVVQYAAESAHWKNYCDEQITRAQDTILKLQLKINEVLYKTKEIVQKEAGHCRDCDVKALLQQIENLRPIQISKP
jgi:hypothetical protein